MNRPKSAGKSRPTPPPPPPPTNQKLGAPIPNTPLPPPPTNQKLDAPIPDTPPPPPPPAHQSPLKCGSDASETFPPPPPAIVADASINPIKPNKPDNSNDDKTQPNKDKNPSIEDINKDKLGVDLKVRNASTSSSEAGGKSPRSNFRKARPAPLPPKPPDKPSILYVNSGSKSSLASSYKSCENVFSGSSGSVNNGSDNGSVRGRGTSDGSGSGTALHKLPANNKTTHKKSIVKPCAPPPQPPTAALCKPATPQTTAAPSANSILDNPGNSFHHTDSAPHGGRKPVINSPKPKIKPIVPPPPPPHQKSDPKARNLSLQQNESSANSGTTSDAVKSEPRNAAAVLDMSDLMRDVLGVIDRTSSTSEPSPSAQSGVSDRISGSGLERKTQTGNTTAGDNNNQHHQSASSNIPTSQRQTEPTTSDDQSHEVSETLQTSSHKDDSKVDSSSGVKHENENTTGSDNKLSSKPALPELSIQIDEQTTAGKRPSSQSPSSPGPQGQYSPSHKSHSRANHSPRNRVRRKRSALGLMLCCGLGRAYLRDKNSPPFELPMRTEGTLPRGNNNVVSSTSLPTVLVPASHSPKKLEQCDVSHSLNNTTNHTDVILEKNSTDKDCGPVITVGQMDMAAVDKKAEGSCTTMNSMTVDNPDNPMSVPPSGSIANHANQPTQQCDFIDALCPSEKPIAINKLQGDNKDLVVNRESASPSPTNTAVDISLRPVVHGVKLVERSSTFSHQNNGLARAGTPRLSNTQLNSSNSDKPHSSHTDIRSHTDSITSNSTDQEERVLLRKDSNSISRDSSKVRSQSMEDLSCIVVDLDLDLVGHLKREDGYRSSFIGEESRPAMTRAPGEVQTILKHGKQDGGVYALPQPACYSDNTLRAVKLITDKYDTLERWKICATSFRGDQTARSSAGQKVAFHATSSPHRQSSRESRKSETGDDVTDSNMERQKSFTPSDDVSTQDSERLVESNAANPYELSPAEMARIKLFYSSRNTQVEVAHCTVDLLLSAKEAVTASEVKEWTQTHSGVPALVLTTGEGRQRRQLSLVLCDRQTSFPLWTDVINHLSQYGALSETRHTLHLSGSLMKLAALQFPVAAAADDFMEQFSALTGDSNDDLWKVAIEARAKHKQKKTAHKVTVKGDISHPIQFDHVTKLTSRDPNLVVNLASYVAKQEVDENEAC